MIILHHTNREEFEKLKVENLSNFGFPYLSPSAINDFKDCSEKLKLRKEYRSVGLTSLTGNIVHNMADILSKKIILRTEKEGITDFFEAREKVFEETSFEDMYDVTVKEMTQDIVIDIITKELLTRQKDYDFMKYRENLNSFYEKIKPYIATKELFELLIDKPIIASETPGYWMNDDKLFYGIIDRISIEDGILYVVDYKTIWSKRSRSNWDNTSTTLQGWIYYKFVEEFVKRCDLDVKEIKVIFKFVEIDLPTKYSNIASAKQLNRTVFDKEMVFTEHDHKKYEQDIKTACTLIESKAGFIGNSKYGCNSCSYKDYCNYYK